MYKLGVPKKEREDRKRSRNLPETNLIVQLGQNLTGEIHVFFFLFIPRAQQSGS